jgi:hypothetical protein
VSPSERLHSLAGVFHILSEVQSNQSINSGPSSSLYSPKCVELAFSEVRGAPASMVSSQA